MAKSDEELLILQNDSILVKRRGKKTGIADPRSLVKLMRANELSKLLKETNSHGESNERKAIENIAVKLPISTLRKSAIDSISGRYSGASTKFWNTIQGTICESDLESLKKRESTFDTGDKEDSIAKRIKMGDLTLFAELAL
jgi:hypothetical protein